MTLEPKKQGTDQLAGSAAAKVQNAVDAVFGARAHQPLDQVRPALRKALKDVGVNLPEQTIDTIAQHIAAGTRVDTTPSD